MRITLAVLGLLFSASPLLAQAGPFACGGNFIQYLGGLPRAAFSDIDRHGPPNEPTPAGMTAQDRELWDAMIFDGFDHPTPSPDGEDYWYPSIPLNERHTRVMGRGDDLPAFFGPVITGEQRQLKFVVRLRVLPGQREPASPASALHHPSQHRAAP